MGMYLNFLNDDAGKIEFCIKYAEEIQKEELTDFIISENSIPICLINNGSFLALGVGFSKREISAFSLDSDGRDRKYFKTTKDNIIKFGNIDEEDYNIYFQS